MKMWTFEDFGGTDELKAWFMRQSENPYMAFYLYHKPGTPAKLGEVRIMADGDNVDGYILSSPERINPSWTMPQVRRFVDSRLGGLPVLGGGH